MVVEVVFCSFLVVILMTVEGGNMLCCPYATMNITIPCSSSMNAGVNKNAKVNEIGGRRL